MRRRARSVDPSSWRKFPKPRRLRAADRWRGPLAFVGIQPELIAEWGCVSLKHAQLIKAGLRAPSPQLLRLVCLYRDGMVLVGGFLGFSVRSGKLVTPDRLEFLPSELRGYGSLLEWARSVADQVGRVEEYYQRLGACRELA